VNNFNVSFKSSKKLIVSGCIKRIFAESWKIVMIKLKMNDWNFQNEFRKIIGMFDKILKFKVNGIFLRTSEKWLFGKSHDSRVKKSQMKTIIWNCWDSIKNFFNSSLKIMAMPLMYAVKIHTQKVSVVEKLRRIKIYLFKDFLALNSIWRIENNLSDFLLKTMVLENFHKNNDFHHYFSKRFVVVHKLSPPFLSPSHFCYKTFIP